MKNIRSYSCRIYVVEKTWLVKGKRAENLSNADSEIYGPCRHNAKFHWLLDPSTDKNGKFKKGKRKKKPKQTRKQKRKALKTLYEKQANRVPCCTVIR